MKKKEQRVRGGGGGKRVVLSTVVSTKVWPLVAIYGTQRYCACTQTFVFLLFSDSYLKSVYLGLCGLCFSAPTLVFS